MQKGSYHIATSRSIAFVSACASVRAYACAPRPREWSGS